MMYDYVVPEPSLGKFGNLIPSNVINARYVQTEIVDPNEGVLRWTQPNARTAEKIARREFERRGGLEWTNLNLGAVQQLVAVVALDQCGTFSAMFAQDNWNWSRWAAFCYYVSGLSNDQFQHLLGLLVGGYCGEWNGISIDENTGVILGNPYDVASDLWYQDIYPHQLPAQGPYDFTEGPYGAASYVPAPDFAQPPQSPPPVGETLPPVPGDLPPVPGDLPPVPGDLPPGETPPPLPPGETPPGPGAIPVGVKEEKKTSDSTVVWGVMGAVALVSLGAWALTRRKANPVHKAKEAIKAVGGDNVRVVY